MRVINLTPHTVNVKVAGFQVSIEPSGPIARVETHETRIAERFLGEGVHGLQVPIIERCFGNVEGLPEPEPDTIYLVSSMVLAAVPDRTDVFAPDTGESAERNDAGHIRSVCRLIGNRPQNG